MSLWDRIRGMGRGGYKERAARRLELAGDLEEAAQAYLDAGLPDEASRVLLLCADAEPKLERRIVLFERAASTAADATLARRAKARRARLAYDLVRAHGTLARAELLAAAEQLEAAGENETAAEAYRLLGDAEGEIRALTAVGAIDTLEERLRNEAAASQRDQARALALRKMMDLDRTGERLEALRIAESVEGPDRDERIDDLARLIRQRLVRGPLCDLILDGSPVTVAFGDAITIGRGEATVVVGSRAISREHLRLRRDPSGAVVAEDMDTRNGTFLQGARLGAAIPVSGPLELTLGADLPCRVAPHPSGGVGVSVAGTDVLAPLGDFVWEGWVLRRTGGPEPMVVLESSEAAPAFLGALRVAPRVEIAVGDGFARERNGAVRLAVGKPA